jgi:hypothetical protein
MRVPLCCAVVDAADGKVTTRLNVADPEVPGGRVGTSLWLFPETTPMQVAGSWWWPGASARRRLRSAFGRLDDAFEAVRRGARSACGSSPADVNLRVSAECER